MKFTMSLGSRDQQFVLGIALQFDAGEVRPLLLRAFEKAPSLTTQESCGAEPHAVPTEQDKLEERV